MKLNALDLPWKLLITLFLIVLTAGFVVSELYLMYTTSKADGKDGMGLNDIVFHFHGDRSSTTLKRNVLGSMKKYFAETENEADLTKEDQEDIAKVVAWSDKGAPEEEYWDPKLKAEQPFKEMNPNSIYVILNKNTCFDCHSADSDMGKQAKKDAPLDTFDDIKKFTVQGGDKGMHESRLLMISHVHLLGMGMMFLLVGAAVAMTTYPAWLRSLLIVGGLSSILFDIFGWWGVKWFGAPLAPMVMLGGILMFTSFTLSVIVSLYDMWLRKPPVIVGGGGGSDTAPKPTEPPVLVGQK